MKLPHRVPWTSLAELDEVCGWIYDSDSADVQRSHAFNRISAWQAATPLPASLSATLSLLSSILLDRGVVPALAVRQSYAMALTRLVNGLVDPLQQGMYARPIASIAVQLGLPTWWVELRHAATHEDLPSLHVLRQATQQALSWLYHNYFLPTLTQSANPRMLIDHSPLSPILKSYKSLSKLITRDKSLLRRNNAEVDRVLREVERWIGEVQVALSAGWIMPSRADDEVNEAGVMDVLCNALLDRGGVIPVSKRKRPTLRSPFLPADLPILWMQLLSYLRLQHPLFIPSLYSTILQRLHTPVHNSELDFSYDACLIGWGIWLVDQWESDLGGRGAALRQVCQFLCACDDARKDSLRTLANHISAIDPKLQQRAQLLLSAVTTSRVGGWRDGDVKSMEERLAQLEASLQSDSSFLPEKPSFPIPLLLPEVAAPGWRKVPAEEWRDRPIGCMQT